MPSLNIRLRLSLISKNTRQRIQATQQKLETTKNESARDGNNKTNSQGKEGI